MGSCDFCSAKSGDCAHGNLAGSTSCEDAKKRLLGEDHRKREVIRLITSGMTRVGGKYYRIKEKDFLAMSLDSLHEIWRFIRDAEQEEMMKVNKARREPWRR